MDCAECKLLADQAAVAAEEVEKIRERIAADFSTGSASPTLIKSLEAAERTYERCLASVQRHAQSHHAASSSSRTLRRCNPITGSFWVCDSMTTERLDRFCDLSYPVVVKREPDPAIVLGEFEQLVMTAVMLLGANAYGMTIHERVEELRPRTVVSIGAVYTTLDRLERKRLVRSWYSDPTPERGGRSKRFFAVEGAGERALRSR